MDARRPLLRLAAVLLLAGLAACSGLTTRPGEGASPPPPVVVPSAASSMPGDTGRLSGSDVARHLQERYDENKATCDRLPAVLCSGILLRATIRGAYHVWNPRPTAPIKNGVSFSWLRKDSGFSALVFGYTNGFIVLPYFYADAPSDGYTQLTVLCIFPFDADTYNRTGGRNDGCGANTKATVANTGPCQDQSIVTASQWMARFGNVPNRYTDQCGFALHPSATSASVAFQAQADIRSQLPQYFSLQNEVMVGTWAQNDARLPLEAFFYLAGSQTGKSEAGQNQTDFKAMTGRWVPVIRMTLPSRAGGAAAFVYNPADQQVL